MKILSRLKKPKLSKEQTQKTIDLDRKLCLIHIFALKEYQIKHKLYDNLLINQTIEMYETRLEKITQTKQYYIIGK
jgi:hypothetical protein